MKSVNVIDSPNLTIESRNPIVGVSKVEKLREKMPCSSFLSNLFLSTIETFIIYFQLNLEAKAGISNTHKHITYALSK